VRILQVIQYFHFDSENQVHQISFTHQSYSVDSILRSCLF